MQALDKAITPATYNERQALQGEFKRLGFETHCSVMNELVNSVWFTRSMDIWGYLRYVYVSLPSCDSWSFANFRRMKDPEANQIPSGFVEMWQEAIKTNSKAGSLYMICKP